MPHNAPEMWSMQMAAIFVQHEVRCNELSEPKDKFALLQSLRRHQLSPSHFWGTTH